MNPSTLCARVLLDELVRLGVRDIVLCPGSRSAPLAYAAHALDGSGRVRLHVRVDERSAAFLALGLGKRTRRPAVVITTSGSAVANLLPAVVEAHHAAVPLLLLTSDRPPELRGVGANQATTQPGLLGDGQLRLLVDLEAPADPARQAVAWRTSSARAYSAATGVLDGGRSAGPVHVNVPFRDPLAPTGSGGTETGTTEALTGRGDGRAWVQLPEAPRAAAPEELAHDGRTLVVIGELPTPQQRRAALDWAAHHGAPVVAEPGPGSNDHVLPHGTLVVGDLDWVRAHLPHRVLLVGRPTLGRAVPALTREPCVRVEVVTPGEPAASGWADATHTAAAVHTLDDLAVSGEPYEPSAWARAWARAGERVAAALSGPLTDRLDGAGVATTLHDALPQGSRLLLGSSSPARDLHLAVGRPREDLDVVTSRGLAGIDGLVSTAAGLALADTDTATYALVGDLTFLHDANGLLLGPHEPEPDLTLVVLDDRGGSIFGTLEYGAPELAAPFERLFATPTRTDVLALARAHAVRAQEATSREELAQAVAERPRGLRVVVVRADLSDRRESEAGRREVVAAALRS